MKYIDEYRDNDQAQILIRAIGKIVTRPWHIMEICGGQTHSIARYRIEEMLPKEITLLHGPGCPVCVTPVEIIDRALTIAKQPNMILTTFGDMMRVPGSKEDLLTAKAQGHDIRMLYSPLDAVQIAFENPDKEIVFFAVGFETTTPVHITALTEAERRNLKNFSLLTSLFTVPPAINTIMEDGANRIDGFLTAGHVCAVTGNGEYHRLAEKHHCPMVVTGFEPVDLLYGIYRCILQLESGKSIVENAYKRAVPENGNLIARKLIEETLELSDQEWRGIGIIPMSGYKIRDKYARFDAAKKYTSLFDKDKSEKIDMLPCIAGDIMKGNKQAVDCPYFGIECSPEHPVGAPMVSTEGVCASYYNYR